VAVAVEVVRPRPVGERQELRPVQAQPGASVGQAVALPPGERAGLEAAVVPRQAVEHEVALPQVAVVVLAEAEVAVALPRAAEHEVVLPQAAVAVPAEVVAEVEVPVVPGARQRAVARRAARVQPPEVQVALPSAVAWVFRRDQPPPWPAPRPVARSARAMKQWWPAAAP